MTDDVPGNEDLEDTTPSINTKEEFVLFLERLLTDYQSSKGDWENTSLPVYFHGMVGFCRDAEGYYKNIGVDLDCDQPSWRLFADILLAARVYD